MLTLFKNQPNVVRRNVAFPRFSYITQRLNDNLQRAVDYYAYRRNVVRSNHLLVKLIESINVPHLMDDVAYFDTVVDASYSTARSLGIGSSIYAPKEFNPGVFYGQEVSEYIYLVPSDYTHEYDDYKKIESVKVKYSPRSDFSMLPLMPEFSNSENGYAVITIDPGLLMLQYRAWKKEQLLLDVSERLTTGHFVFMYVLPNMLYSHLDVVWLNRLINYSSGRISAGYRSISGLALPTVETFTQDITAKIIEVMTERTYRFDSILLGIPTPFSDTFLDVAMLPNQPKTIAVKGFELLCTLPWLEFMFALESNSGSQQNRIYENELRVALRRAKNERWLSFIDRSDLESIESRIETLQAVYLNN